MERSAFNDLCDLFGACNLQFPLDLVDKYKNTPLLLVGGAYNVWEEARGIPEYDHVMCVNDIGMYWPGRVRHWYSNDCEQLMAWKNGRRRKYAQIWGQDYQLHSCFDKGYERIRHWPFPGNGSSGLVAMYVAASMGYSPIRSIGIPFDGGGHFFGPPSGHNLNKNQKWSDFNNETRQEYLEKVKNIFKGVVFPESGRLKEVLSG